MDTCIACLEDIKSNAPKCSHCGAYQRSWLNWLHTITAVGILQTFLATSLLGIFAFSTDVWERFFWKDDLTIISFQSPDNLVARNSGAGAVFIEHVSAKYVGAGLALHQKNIAIGKMVAKNSFFSFEKSGGGTVHFKNSVSDDVWESMKRLTVPGISPHFFSEDHTNLKAIEKFYGANIRTFEAECEVGFRSIMGDNLVRQPFPCVCVFVRFVREYTPSSE